jgi:glycosyltransferase involved in cell wall biosynthesis
MMVRNNSNKLSVIVAVYNYEKYIEECLRSILNQTYKNIEIILCDDCSTDNSYEVIKSYVEMYPDIIKCFRLDKNSGVARCRHDAILTSSGKYITTLDSDDYFFFNRKLEKEMELIRKFKEEKNKDVIAFSNTVVVTEGRKIVKRYGNQKNIRQGKIFENVITRTSFIPRDFIMLRSQYFNVGGYDPSFKIYEDWDLKIRLSAKYKFYYTGIDGTAYRRHGKGLSSAGLLEHAKVMKKIFQKNSIYFARSNVLAMEDKFKTYLTKYGIN